MTALGRACALAACLALPALGCEKVLGIDFQSVHSGSPCTLKVPPAAPDVTDAGGDLDFTVVINDVDYGGGVGSDGTPDYFHIGYDLDGNCAGHGQPPPCTPPSWTGGDPTDGPNGQDNGVGYMLRSQSKAYGVEPITKQSLTDGIQRGIDPPPAVIRVRGYNGFHVDDHVTVDWFVAQAPKNLSSGSFVPKFDGSDRWPLVAGYVAAGASDAGTSDGGAVEPSSQFHTDSAYVDRETLVARFDTAVTPLVGVYFDVQHVVLTATLIRDLSDHWILQDGVIAGIADTRALLRVIPLVTQSTLGTTLCTDNPVYPDVKKFICAGSDSRIAAPLGGTCDAISFGIAFQSAPTLAGDAVPLTPSPSQCVGRDPANDDCQTAPK